MLFLHEVHRVAGREADRFEELFRDGYLGALASTSTAGETAARLAWFMHQGHGTGPAYVYVTITALANERAWAALAERTESGDMAAWRREVDSLRHESTAKLLAPTAFSPLQALDLDAVPAEPVDRGRQSPATLFMEDTAWPHRGQRENYLEKAGTLYVDTLRKAAGAGHGLLELVAAFVPRFGAGKGREVVLWQRVAQPEGLLPLLSHEVAPQFRTPGTWMHDALDVRDQWESRLLRVARWSPLA